MTFGRGLVIGWIKTGLMLCIVGFAFPIYGIPVAGFKLTLWRAGLLLLLPWCFRFRFQSRASLSLLSLFVALAFLRGASLVAISDRAAGVQQLTWFIEGIAFLLALTNLSSVYSGLFRYYVQTVFVVGLVSVGVMALQFLLVYQGRLFTLPLSTTAFGMSSTLRPWTYPLYGGGRIIGAFYEPNMSGSMCALFIALFLPSLFMRVEKAVVKPGLAIIGIGLAGVGLVGSGSRQAALATGLTMVVTAGFFVLWHKAMTKRTVLRLSALALLTLVPLGIFLTSSQVITPFGETQENVLVRGLRIGEQGSQARLYFIREILSSMTAETLLFGIGEGRGILTAHNAYVITLNQLGIGGAILLVALSIGLLFATFRYTLTQRDETAFGLGVASLTISLTWVLLILINWAQFNQSLSYLYLAVPLLFLNQYGRAASRD